MVSIDYSPQKLAMLLGKWLVGELASVGSSLRGAARDVLRDALVDAMRDREFRDFLVQYVHAMTQAEVKGAAEADVEAQNLKAKWQKGGAKPVREQAIIKAAIAAVQAEDAQAGA
jgi:hypothetical protein